MATDSKQTKKKLEKNIAHVGALISVFRNVEKQLHELFVEEQLNDERWNKIVVLYNTLKEKFENITKLQERIIELLNPEELAEAIEENATFEISANEIIFHTQTFIQKRNRKLEEETNEHKSRSRATNIKLPRLVIKTFDGNVLAWNAFYDSFKAAVHESDLTNVEKFNYLRGYLNGQALKTIEGLALSNENYEKALELLRERFGKKEIIISKHMSDLLKLKTVTNDKDVKGLRIFHDTLESHLRSLLSLNVDSKSYGALLTPIVMEKLPMQLRLVLGRDLQGEGWDLTKLLSTLKTELTIRESCMDMSKLSMHSDQENEYRNENPYTANALLTNESNIKCAFCRKEHYSDKCKTVTDIEMRKSILQKSGKCFRCLKPGHISKNCTYKKVCFYCKEKHNSALCRNREKNIEKTQNLFIDSNNSIFLQTAVIYVSNKENSCRTKARVVLDTGSQKSYISKRIQQQLNIKSMHKESLELCTFGRKDTSIKTMEQAVINMSSVNKSSEQGNYSLNAFVVDNICSPLKNFDVTDFVNNYDYLKGLELAETGEGVGNVDILVGCDHYWNCFTGKTIKGQEGPTASESVFGWVLSGPVFKESKSREGSFNGLVTTSHVLRIQAEESENCLDEQLHKFWDLETLGITQNEKSLHDSYTDDIVKNSEGRYQVKLPFKEDFPTVSDNYELCEKRLRNKLKTLKKDPELQIKYDKIFKEQLELGIIEKVNDVGVYGQTSYLPHHPVVRNDKETTKVRAVFDASAKSSHGTSLNDCLLKGPQLTPLIFDILLRFRQHSIALVADIEKAFLQISIEENQRDFLRFLWVDDILKDEPVITRNRFARLVFGVTSSPFLLNGTIHKHMEQYKWDNEFYNKVLNSFFVDDFVGGGNSKEYVLELLKKLKFRFLDGKFTLRKWRTNNNEIREQIRNMDGSEQSNPNPAKVLGIQWDEVSDTFILNLKNHIDNALKLVPTKRNILSVLSSFYDPLGFIQPLVVSMKLMFQTICRTKLTWDEELPLEIRQRWRNVLEDMTELPVINVNRQYLETTNDDTIEEYELHGFSDASPQAYGACVYLKGKSKSGVTKTAFITSKSRISPMKPPTLPRLELLGNVLLSRLMNSVKSALQSELLINKFVYWTDSKICLAWINSKKEFKPFLENRIREIRSNTSIASWHYLPSSLNPADYLTRQSTTPSEFLTSKLWWSGPENVEVINPTESENVNSEEKENFDEFSAELKAAPQKCLSIVVTPIKQIIEPTRFSSYKRLLRVTAWTFRFISNIKRKRKKEELNYSHLTAAEMRSAEEFWIREIQKPHIKNEAEKNQLNVKKDENGIYRCFGRLQNAPLPYEERTPILLHPHYVTKLIIEDIHISNKHCWDKQTLNELRQRFWIVKGRQYVKKILFQCRTCRKHNGQSYHYPETPALPAIRLNDARPFVVTGVDLCGPLFARNVYVNETNDCLFKCWVVLYTCAASRGIVLDLVPDPKARSFLRSLTRFISRRGCPDDIITDNGTNFTANDTQSFASHLNIDWHFNIPLAPWYGGFFERLVRSIKYYLRKNLGTTRLNYEEIQTLLIEIEQIVNNRPISYQYATEIEQCLTPNHLLFGHKLHNKSLKNDRNIHQSIDGNVTSNNLNNLLTHFWNRWRHEYLAELREHHQRRRKMSNTSGLSIHEDDIVLIHEDNVPRASWKIARVQAIIKGKDDQVRGAVVRTRNSQTLRRPINKLFPIEMKLSNANDSAEKLVNEPLSTVEEKEGDEHAQTEGDEHAQTEGDEHARTYTRNAAKNSRAITKTMFDESLL